MVELKRMGVAVLVAVLGLGPAPSRAITFVDPLNLIQNILSVLEAMKQVDATYQQLHVQWQQAQAMARQLKSMDPSQIAGVLGDITGRDELLQLERALAANRDLIGSLNTIRRGFDERRAPRPSARRMSAVRSATAAGRHGSGFPVARR